MSGGRRNEEKERKNKRREERIILRARIPWRLRPSVVSPPGVYSGDMRYFKPFHEGRNGMFMAPQPWQTDGNN